MKRISFYGLIILTAIIGLAACQNGTRSNQAEDQISNDQPGADSIAVIKFEVDSYDFGDIAPGEKVSYTFTYRNEGEENLIIMSATAGCGCTIPKWKKDPLPPGKEGHIEVIFDSTGRSGAQIKTVTIRSNGDPPVIRLQIKANIIKSNS